MKSNMGTLDRIIRVVIAIIIFIFMSVGHITGTLAVVIGFLGGIIALTSIIGICPVYLLYEINTKKNAHS